MKRRPPFDWLHRPLPCHVVGERLQEYLDHEVDEVSARRIRRHLKDCRRCGLELEVYAEIKQSLAQHGDQPDPAALDRLHAFGQRLAELGSPGAARAE